MKLKAIIAAAVVAVVSLFSGCDTNEAMIVAGANTAGNIGLSAWFAIDDPDDTVKHILKDVVTITTEASTRIGAGESYLDALTPVIQEIVAAHSNLTGAQKNLINTGSSVILSGIDTFITTNEKVKGNTALVSRVVASFGQGCLTAINRSASTAAAKSIKKAHGVIMMKYDADIKAFSAN